MGYQMAIANAFLHIPQLVGQQFQVLTYLFGHSSRVDLRVFMLVCPNRRLTVSMGTPLDNSMVVAAECLAT